MTGRTRRPIVEFDRTPIGGGASQRLERRLAGGHPRLDRDRHGVVDVDARGAQFQNRLEGLAAEAGVLPRAGSDTEHGQLSRFERDVRQAVIVATDPVTGLVVEGAVAAGFQRDAEVAQVFLVAFELALERLVTEVLVARDGPPNLVGGQVAPGRQQADHEVEQALGLAGRHGRDVNALRLAAPVPARSALAPLLHVDEVDPTSTSTRSTTKISVSPGAIAPPAPRSP